MAAHTGIQWTDHTFNPWWGCTRIAPGCDNCYAATFDKRTGGDYWNPHTAPRRTSETNWKKVHKWNDQAKAEGRRHRVFCGSMMDWCDIQVPEWWRTDLFRLIRATPWVDWQLLTKRATRIGLCIPPDWGDGYENVWLGTTVENREHGFPRIEHLREIPARTRFLSVEPLLEDLGDIDLTGIHWVIVGGESGPGARIMEPLWADHVIAQCREQNIPLFFKQWGGQGKQKGGCLINNHEIKEFPSQVNI